MSDESKSSALPMPVVDEATWLTKRKELLEKEKQLMKLKVGPCHPAVGLWAPAVSLWRIAIALQDEVSCARRSLGMKKVSTDYVFQGVDGESNVPAMALCQRRVGSWCARAWRVTATHLLWQGT